MLTPAQIAIHLKDAPAYPDKRNLFTSFFVEPPRDAAVLVPLMHPPDDEINWHILFTRRTDTVADHKGQVAFPGGRAEPGDDFPNGTALREAQEEIGLAPSDVTILGNMEKLLTISNFMVTPVVGHIPWNYAFQPHPGEVSRVFAIPLSWLSHKDHIEIRQRAIQFPTMPAPQMLRVIYFKKFEDELVWGISAEITLRLLVILNLVPPLWE